MGGQRARVDGRGRPALLGKPGGAALMEACACGLPLLAFDPLPG